jgi:N-succinyl-L-ornithine transcarbamylase
MKVSANAKIMHCLPVRRDVELNSALLDSEQSVVIQQAGNRVPAAQAVLLQMIRDNYRAKLNLSTGEITHENSIA